jgi:hypothetical protein
VNFVDKEDIAGIEVGQKAGQITWFFKHGAGGHAQGGFEFLGDDVRQGGFTEAGRAVQQNVVEGVAALFGGLDEDLKVIHDFLLTTEFVQQLGAQGFFKQFVFPGGFVREFFADGKAILIAGSKIDIFCFKTQKVFFPGKKIGLLRPCPCFYRFSPTFLSGTFGLPNR